MDPTDPTEDSGVMVKMIAGVAARAVMNSAATYMVTMGLVQPNDKGSFIQIGAGVLVGAAGFAWSWWQKSGHAKVEAALRRVTDSSTTTEAVATAKALPEGAAVGGTA